MYMKKIILLLYSIIATSILVSCNNNQPITGIENGHMWVDLGLSVKWAKYNIGADSAKIKGYTFYNKSLPNNITNPTIVNDTVVIGIKDDDANQEWGGKWRSPSASEIQELIDNCTWNWSNENGIYGYKVTSNIKGFEGSSIFLPCNLDGFEGYFGIYWTNSIHFVKEYKDGEYRWGCLKFDEVMYFVDEDFEFFSGLIRPVCAIE